MASINYCFVPTCSHNSRYYPEIKFFSVPHNRKQRTLWFNAVGRECDNINFRRTYACCESHIRDSDMFKVVQDDGQIKTMLKPYSLPSLDIMVDDKHENHFLKSTQKTEFCNIEESHEIIEKIESQKKSTGTQTSLQLANKSSQTISPQSTPIKTYVNPGLDNSTSPTSTITAPTDRSSNLDEYLPSSSGSESVTIREITISIMKHRPRHYMGINKTCLHVIEVLKEKTDLSELEVMLTLRKIRLNEEYQTLADLFDIDRRTAGKYFQESVGPISKYLSKFIKYVKSNSIKRNLPISFRRNYNRIGYILDCFEIQIEKPTKPAVTPDGLICYVSPGYGDRSSDRIITTNSKLHKAIRSKFSVMADRGFKGIDDVLLRKGSKLYRPPSATGCKMTKKEVLLTKQIASLRIHVERAISRIRDFNMCKPHVTLDHNFVPKIDKIVKIACGLANIQQQLTKTI